jgi:hypothetical protein
VLCSAKEFTTTVPQTGSFSPGNVQAVTAHRSNNVVAQCMDLLQHNLDVQALLVSLPRDLAIWKAFVKNEKVQELMQSHNRKLPQLEGVRFCSFLLLSVQYNR